MVLGSDRDLCVIAMVVLLNFENNNLFWVWFMGLS